MRRLAQSILFTTRESSVSRDAEPAKRPAELNEGQPEKQGENRRPPKTVLSKIRKMVLERMRPHRSWRGFATPTLRGRKRFCKTNPTSPSRSLRIGRKHL